MKKESGSMDLLRTHVRKILTICFFVLIVIVAASMAMDSEKNALPMAVVLLLVVVALIRICRDSVVEIVIRDGIAEMESFDKSRRQIPLEDIVVFRESSSGGELILSNKSKMRIMKRPLQVTVYNEGRVAHEIRQEDFPDVRFIKKR